MAALMPSDPPPAAIPERIGRYRIMSKLGEGGMARVYVALREGASQICVLKQLQADLRSNEMAAKRFLREAQVAAYLMHRNIALVLGAGFEDENFCIAFEFIPGMDLEAMSYAMLDQGKLLPYQVTLTAIAGILSGLEHAHAARDPDGAPLGLIHRDLSPRNMMLGFDGVPKVIDFGLARGKFEDFQTAPGTILGTLRFCSPEQVSALPIDARGDLYSVGAVLHELLTGSVLVKPGKPLEVVKGVLDLVPQPMSSINAQLPPALDAVVLKALARNPNDRWATAAQFREALLAATDNWALTPASDIANFLANEFAEERRKALKLLELSRTSDAPPPLGAPQDATWVVSAKSSESWVVPQPLPAASETSLKTLTAHYPRPSERPAPSRARSIPAPSVRPAPVAVQALAQDVSLVTTEPAPARLSLPMDQPRRSELWRGRLQGSAGVLLFGAIALVVSWLRPAPVTLPVPDDPPIAAVAGPVSAREPTSPTGAVEAPASASAAASEGDQPELVAPKLVRPDETRSKEARAAPRERREAPSVPARPAAKAPLEVLALSREIRSLFSAVGEGDADKTKKLRAALIKAKGHLPDGPAKERFSAQLKALEDKPSWSYEVFQPVVTSWDRAVQDSW